MRSIYVLLLRLLAVWMASGNLNTTWFDIWLHCDRPTWEMIWKIFFTFDFHILPQQRYISARTIPSCVDPFTGNELKPSLKLLVVLERSEIMFIPIRIIAIQNSYHDDKSTYQYFTHVFCAQLIRNMQSRRHIDSSSIIAHLVNFNIQQERSLKCDAKKSTCTYISPSW